MTGTAYINLQYSSLTKQYILNVHSYHAKFAIEKINHKIDHVQNSLSHGLPNMYIVCILPVAIYCRITYLQETQSQTIHVHLNK